jgi:hypothetical protein
MKHRKDYYEEPFTPSGLAITVVIVAMFVFWLVMR